MLAKKLRELVKNLMTNFPIAAGHRALIPTPLPNQVQLWSRVGLQAIPLQLSGRVHRNRSLSMSPVSICLVFVLIQGVARQQRGSLFQPFSDGVSIQR